MSNAGIGWVYQDLATPGFSARECAKQLVLLEDHLACPGKDCPDCIAKHRLAAEGFAEEALTLGGRASWLMSLPANIRGARSAGDVRAVRKELTANMMEAGLIGLGRLRGALGASATAWTVKLAGDMHPESWASSDPALKLGFAYLGSRDSQHLFSSCADPATITSLLGGDPRVEWAEMTGSEALLRCPEPPRECKSCPPVVEEARPEPGKPQLVLPGYIPKFGGPPHLTWDEKLAAASSPALDALGRQASVPWWMILLLAALALRR